MICTIPIRLVSEANAHEHWRQLRAKAQRHAVKVHLWRDACYYRDHFPRNPETASPLTVTITRIAPRRLDSDNAVGSAKHIRDQVAELLGIDDGDPRVDWRVEQRGAVLADCCPKRYGVEIRIETRV